MQKTMENPGSLDGGSAFDASRSDVLPAATYSMELVARHQGGDGQALNELLDRYLPRLRRIVQARMSPELARQVEADDIVQDSMQIAARKVDGLELRGHGAILRWLATIAEHKIRDKVDYFRAQKRDVARQVALEPGSSPGDSSGTGPLVPAPGSTPSSIASQHEFEELVDAHVAQLQPEAYRDVILLRSYEEASWEEIRERLERPSVEAVQEMYRRAQVKLRLSLAPILARLGPTA
jgi:RNA polymerase sigma-70 factor (subfamily 1)